MPTPRHEEMARAVLWTGVSTFSATGNLGAYHAHPWTRRDSESGGSGQEFPPSVLQVT